jgi:predicted RNA-binding protein Jag
MQGEGPASVTDLNSYERRLVHMVVREFDGVESHSVGEGTHKEVLIELSNPED